MKPPSENHDLTRWLDGVMSDAERSAFEQHLAEDPTLSREANALKSLRADLRTHLPAEMNVPYGDFFNSQIQVRLAQEESRRVSDSAHSSAAKLLQWLKKPWLALAGTAAATAVLTVALLRTPDADSYSRILSSYTPDIRVEARSFHDDAAQATVLVLDGLDEVPAERKVSGINVHRSENEPEIAATALFDAGGKRLLTISRDAVGNPQFTVTPPRG